MVVSYLLHPYLLRVLQDVRVAGLLWCLCSARLTSSSEVILHIASLMVSDIAIQSLFLKE